MWAARSPACDFLSDEGLFQNRRCFLRFSAAADGESTRHWCVEQSCVLRLHPHTPVEPGWHQDQGIWSMADVDNGARLLRNPHFLCFG